MLQTETRQARRDRLARLAALPDSEIHIKWGRVAVTLFGLVSLLGMGALFGVILTAWLGGL